MVLLAAAVAAAAALAAAAASPPVLDRHPAGGGDGQQQPLLLPEPALRLTFVSQPAAPIIDTLATPGTQDNLFGFEGGRAIKQGGRYYYFAAEMFAQPLDANMRIALWSSAAPEGPWRRERTIQQSNQTYPLLSFTQQCDQPYCTWKGARRDRFVMQMVYDCDPDDLLASPWAPFPIFDEADNAWHVLFVSYMCDGTWFVAVGLRLLTRAPATRPDLVPD